jgi:hypothetical protein
VRWLILLALLSPPAFADLGSASAPTQLLLTKLLRGNSIEGVWAGSAFVQHFASDGSTRYREKDGLVSVGSWRVNGQGQYCSIWRPSSGETCYAVLVDVKNIYWKSGKEYFPSSVSAGDIFQQ